MNRRQKWILIFMLAVLGAGCARYHPDDPGLDGTSWNLTSLGGEPLLAGSDITLHVNGEEIQGSAGCNTYFGGIRIKGNQIEIQEIGWTEMACLTPEGVMKQEQSYLSTLEKIDSFEVSDKLLILRSNSTELLRMERMD